MDNHLNDRDHLIQRLTDMAQLTSIELNCFMLNLCIFVLTWSFCLGVFSECQLVEVKSITGTMLELNGGGDERMVAVGLL